MKKNIIIEKFYKQEGCLPKKIETIVTDVKNHKIMIYALSDMNEDYQFHEKWIVLTTKSLFVFEDNQRDYNEIALQEISDIRLTTAPSCQTITLIKGHDMPALLKMRYTGRQKVVFDQIKFLLEEFIKENNEFLNRENGKAAIDIYQDGVSQSIIEAQNMISSEKQEALYRLLKYLVPYKQQLFTGLVGAVFATAFSLVPPLITGALLDDIIRPYQKGLMTVDHASSMALNLFGLLVLCYVCKELFLYLRLNRMSKIGEYVASDLRKELFEHLQTLGMDFYSKKHSGSIISRVSSDTERIWDFVAFGVVEVSIAFMSLIGLSTVLMFLDFKLGLIMTIPVPIMLYSIYAHGNRMKALFIKAWRKWSSVTSILSDTIPGMQVVKAFNQEQKTITKFNNKNNDVTDEFMAIHEVWTGFWPKLMLAIHTSVMAVWFFAIPRLLTNTTEDAFLSAGTFISFLLYMTMYSAPIEVIGQVTRMLNRALSSAHRIFEILDTNPTIENGKNAICEDSLKGQIEFKNVSFSYDGVKKVLKRMNFSIRPGEMIGLVGSSGGGKSTITKLLTRFYDVDEGKILIDGIDLKSIEIGSLRKQVGMVLQEPYLFHGSIWENINYGRDTVDMKKIIESAKAANAHDFILSLPNGYDTIIGERGHTLSGGERQRVSIARAILCDPKILILDEATSAVDTETERNIQGALDNLIKGRTVIAIAHRLSTLRKANRIFVVDKGCLAECDTHENLLNKEDGIYKKLHQMQKEMDESFAV